MKTYLRVFVNYEQNNWAKLFLIVEFVYNNRKNGSTCYISFKLNYNNNPKDFYKEEINLYLKLKTRNKPVAKLKMLMTICKKNLYYTQELQK